MPLIASIRRALLSPYVLMVLPPLFWAGNAVVGRAVVGQLSPFALAFWRWLFAFLLLLPLGLPRLLAERHCLRANWKRVAVLALFSVTAYNSLLYVAVTTTTAINATLVGAVVPVVIVLLSWLWLGERATGRQMAGMAVALAGVVVVVSRGDPGALLAFRLHAGDLLALAAVVCWAISAVVLRRYPTGLDSFALLTAQIGFGLCFLVPLFGWELVHGGQAAIGWHTAGHVAYVAVFPSVVAYLVWNKGVLSLGPNLAGQYSNLVPLFTALLAVLFLGEAVRWFHGVALVLILSGIWLATYPRAVPAPRQSPSSQAPSSQAPSSQAPSSQAPPSQTQSLRP